VKGADPIAAELETPFDPGPLDELDDKPIASLHFLRGLGFFHSGGYDRATMHLMTTIDYDPEHPTARYWIGRSFFALEEYAHARIALKRFVEARPKSDRADDARRRIETCDQRRPASPDPAD